MHVSESHAATGDALRSAHIVDTLIEERAGHLLQRPLVWAFIRLFGFPLLRYRQAVQMADAVRPLAGEQVFDWLSAHLRLDVAVEGLGHLPSTGRVLLACNHPTGIADGVALWDAVRDVRRDLLYFANRDAIRVAPRMSESVIPVEWVQQRRTRQRTRETLKAAIEGFRADRAVVLFPSGRLAYQEDGVLRERPWLTTAVNLATRYGAPVVPMHLTGRNSRLFYFLSRWNEQLRDMAMFHELLNKTGYPYRLRIGPPIAPEDLAGDQAAVTAHLQAWVEHGLPRGKPFEPLRESRA